MNDKQYYRLYINLQKKHERLSYKIVLNGFKSIFTKASKEYLVNQDAPLDLSVSEVDTLNMLLNIYLSVGVDSALLVDKSLNKYKSHNHQFQTKADKDPKQYQPTPEQNKINLWKEEFKRFANSPECAAKVRGVTNTTKAQIRKIMEFAVENKLSHKQTAKLILDETESINTKKRALLIARTENAVGSNLGAMYAAKSTGLVLYKRWIARSGDSRTRDQHAKMVGSKPIPMNDLFEVGGDKMAHPADGSHGAGADNICNCRCIISFVSAASVVNRNFQPSTPSLPKPKPSAIKPSVRFDEPVFIKDPNLFTPSKSIDEAMSYAINNGFAETVDYTWTKDLKVANEFNRVLLNLKQRFNYDPLGQIGKQAQKKALMSANFKNLNVKHSYWKSEKIIFNNYAKNVDDFKGRMLRNLEIANMNYELTKRFAWKMEAARIQNQLKYTRWTIKYSKEQLLESTIHHEFGHVLHDQLIGGLNGDMALNNVRRMTGGYSQMARELNSEHIKLYKLAQQNGDIYKISAYGASNNKEFFAETFVMYMAKDPELPVYLLEYFDKLFRLTKI